MKFWQPDQYEASRGPVPPSSSALSHACILFVHGLPRAVLQHWLRQNGVANVSKKKVLLSVLASPANIRGWDFAANKPLRRWEVNDPRWVALATLRKLGYAADESTAILEGRPDKLTRGLAEVIAGTARKDFPPQKKHLDGNDGAGGKEQATMVRAVPPHMNNNQPKKAQVGTALLHSHLDAALSRKQASTNHHMPAVAPDSDCKDTHAAQQRGHDQFSQADHPHDPISPEAMPTFDGSNPEDLSAFISGMRLYFEVQPQAFDRAALPGQRARLSFMLSHTRGKAFTALCEEIEAFDAGKKTYDDVLSSFCSTFTDSDSNPVEDGWRKIRTLRQQGQDVSAFNLAFKHAMTMLGDTTSPSLELILTMEYEAGLSEEIHAGLQRRQFNRASLQAWQEAALNVQQHLESVGAPDENGSLGDKSKTSEDGDVDSGQEDPDWSRLSEQSSARVTEAES